MISNNCIQQIKWNEARRLLNTVVWAPEVSIYQSVEFLTITGKGRKFRFGSLWNLKGVKEYNLIQYKAGTVCAFAPLLINTTKKSVVFRGQYVSTALLGFLYTADWCYNDFCLMMETIRTTFKDYTIEFCRIYEETLLYSYLREYSTPNDVIIMEPSVSINISEGYEKWYDSLSKSTRRNIKTSYTRLKNANIDLKLIVTSGNTMKHRNKWKRLIIYSKRIIEKNFISPRIPRKILYLGEAVNKRLDPMAKALRRMKESFSAEVIFNNQIAAFLEGFISGGNRLFIPYLTINENFKQYSPGGILISETIKYLRSVFKDYTVEHFDLSNGDEPYKIKYGGVIYNTYTFKYVPCHEGAVS